jgi:type IV secretory pathway TrbF-like protein
LSINSGVISPNGRSQKKLPTLNGQQNPYSEAQAADLGEAERAYRSADSWRRVASIEGLALIAMTLALVLLTTRSQHDVFVFKENSHGQLSYQDEAVQRRSPSQLAVEAQLGAYIKAIRDVPGLDLALVDRNVTLALSMTADVQPARAHQDLLAYFTDPTNNPKLISRDGTVRAVLDPVIVSPISNLTYTVSWGEETRKPSGKPSREFHQGTVTIADPVLPTDPQVAAINPAGVIVVEQALHL